MSAIHLPKYLAIAQQVETELSSGAFAERKFPSVRDLATAHGVSVVTASRAMQVLRDKGMIETVGRSGSFPTRPDEPAGPVERWAVVLRSTPGPWRLTSMAIPMAGFAAAAAEQGVTLEPEVFDSEAWTTPAHVRREVRQAAQAGVNGVFLMPSRHGVESARRDEAFLAACRDEGLPAVLVERNLRGRARPLEHDLVANDDLDGGYRSARHLIELGRGRVAFVTGSPTSSHEGRVAGYLLALHQEAGDAGTRVDPLVLEQRAGLPTREAYQELVDQVLEQQVDGVVCYQDYTAVGLIMELLTRQKRVPADVAITGFDNLPIGNSFALGVTTYEYPAATIARQAFRLMRERAARRDAPPVKVVVPGALIVRESSDPSASTSASP